MSVVSKNLLPPRPEYTLPEMPQEIVIWILELAGEPELVGILQQVCRAFAYLQGEWLTQEKISRRQLSQAYDDCIAPVTRLCAMHPKTDPIFEHVTPASLLEAFSAAVGSPTYTPPSNSNLLVKPELSTEEFITWHESTYDTNDDHTALPMTHALYQLSLGKVDDTKILLAHYGHDWQTVLGSIPEIASTEPALISMLLIALRRAAAGANIPVTSLDAAIILIQLKPHIPLIMPLEFCMLEAELASHDAQAAKYISDNGTPKIRYYDDLYFLANPKSQYHLYAYLRIVYAIALQGIPLVKSVSKTLACLDIVEILIDETFNNLRNAFSDILIKLFFIARLPYDIVATYEKDLIYTVAEVTTNYQPNQAVYCAQLLLQWIKANYSEPTNRVAYLNQSRAAHIPPRNTPKSLWKCASAKTKFVKFNLASLLLRTHTNAASFFNELVTEEHLGKLSFMVFLDINAVIRAGNFTFLLNWLCEHRTPEEHFDTLVSYPYLFQNEHNGSRSNALRFFHWVDNSGYVDGKMWIANAFASFVYDAKVAWLVVTSAELPTKKVARNFIALAAEEESKTVYHDAMQLLGDTAMKDADYAITICMLDIYHNLQKPGKKVPPAMRTMIMSIMTQHPVHTVSFSPCGRVLLGKYPYSSSVDRKTREISYYAIGKGYVKGATLCFNAEYLELLLLIWIEALPTLSDGEVNTFTFRVWQDLTKKIVNDIFFYTYIIDDDVKQLANLLWTVLEAASIFDITDAHIKMRLIAIIVRLSPYAENGYWRAVNLLKQLGGGLSINPKRLKPNDMCEMITGLIDIYKHLSATEEKVLVTRILSQLLPFIKKSLAHEMYTSDKQQLSRLVRIVVNMHVLFSFYGMDKQARTVREFCNKSCGSRLLAAITPSIEADRLRQLIEESTTPGAPAAPAGPSSTSTHQSPTIPNVPPATAEPSSWIATDTIGPQ